MSKHARVALFVAVAVAAAGCGGGKAPIAKSELSDLVLRSGDLSEAFSQFDGGALARSDIEPGPRQDQNRFGREGGWKARFRRAEATAKTAGPLVIESRADLFKSTGGAKDDLAAYEQQFRRTQASRALSVPKLGDGSHAVVQEQGTLRLYSIAWREANATASVAVAGFVGKLTFDQVLALARKQDAHLSQAAD